MIRKVPLRRSRGGCPMNRCSLAMVCLVLGGLAGSYFVAPLVQGQGKQPQQPPAMPRELTSYRDVVKRVLPAVVSIDAQGKPKKTLPAIPDADFVQQPGEQPKTGFGSGVLVDARGAVLTAFH